VLDQSDKEFLKKVMDGGTYQGMQSVLKAAEVWIKLAEQPEEGDDGEAGTD
jgi:hypothetical protein